MANTPPPYSNITGTSAIVGKYNQQEDIANADGNAKPGQLIVDLATDPPQLYIGNNSGNISLVASGGGGGFSLGNPAIDSGGGGGSYIDSNATSVATSDGQFDLSGTFNGASITNLGFYNNTAGYISIVRI